MKRDGHRSLKRVKRVALVAFVAIGLAANAHPNAALHYKDLDLFLGGYKSTPLGEIAYRISDSIDNEIAIWFRQKYGSIPGNHRILGHGYTLGEAIPRETLDAIEKKYGVSAVDEVIKHQQEIAKKYLTQIQEVTGLPRTQTRALLRQFSNSHLLGDLMEDNKLINLVRDFDSICKSEIQIMDDLFGRIDPKYAQKVVREIKSIQRSAMPVAKKAERLTQLFGRFKVDAALNKSYGNVFKKASGAIVYNIDQAVNRNAILVVRMEKFFSENYKAAPEKVTILKQFHKEMKLPKSAFRSGPGNNPSKIYSPARLSRMNGVKTVKQTVGILKQVTMKNGAKGVALIVPSVGKAAQEAAKGATSILSTAGGSGITAGVMTFVISQGTTSYQFIKGDISEEDFYWESTKNITEAILVGTAVFVAVTLGATPYGWVVLAVGVTTAIVCEVTFYIVKRMIDGPGFDLEDIIGGVPMEIKNRLTVFDYTDNNEKTFRTILNYQSGESPLIYRGRGESPFEQPKGASPFDFQPNREGPLDFNNKQ